MLPLTVDIIVVTAAAAHVDVEVVVRVRGAAVSCPSVVCRMFCLALRCSRKLLSFSEHTAGLEGSPSNICISDDDVFPSATAEHEDCMVSLPDPNPFR